MGGRTSVAQRPVPAASPAASRTAPRSVAPLRNYGDTSPSYTPMPAMRWKPIDDAGFATYDGMLGVEVSQTKTYGQLLPALPSPRSVPPPKAPPTDKARSADSPPAAGPDPAGNEKKAAADKDKSEDGGKEKGDKKGGTATKAGPGADAAPAGSGKSDGKAGAKAGQQLAKLAGLEKAPAVPLPMPSPTIGGHHLARPGFRARMPVGSFDAERELDVHPAVASANSAGAAQEPVADYRSLYTGAVDESFGLYRRLMHEAELIVASADRRNRELELLHQSKLDASLNLLDTTLLSNRARLAHGSEQLRLTLDTRADRLRRRIRGACATGIGRLEQRLRDYNKRIQPLRDQAAPIIDESKTGPKSVFDTATAAMTALDGVISSPGSKIPEEYGTMSAAGREAKVDYAPGYATCDKELVQKTQAAINEFLVKSFACIECDFTLAFQGLEGQVANMDGPGRKAIYAAQDGALKSVGSTVKSLREAIDANEDATERMLIQQHDRTRESLIEASENNSEREAEAVSEGAERQSATLAGMAAGQPRAVQAMHDLLAEQAGSPPAAFARSVDRAAIRLKANLAGIAGRQPRTTADTAARIGEGQFERARQFGARQQAIVAGSNATLEEIVAQAMLHLDKQVFDSIASMDDVPGNVLKQADAVLAPLGPIFEGAVQDLSDSVGALGAQVHQVLNGGEAMAKHDAGVAARKKNEKPPPPPKEPKTPGGAKDKAPPEPAPVPAKCAGDCATRGADKGKDKPGDKAGPAPTAPDGSKPPAGPAQAEAKGPEEGADNTPYGFKKLCEKIKADPLSAPQLAGFLKRAQREVTQKLADRAGNIQKALATTFAPETGLLMESVRGLSKIQGQAVCYQYYLLDSSMTLEEKITKKYKDAVWSAEKTDNANRDAAIAMLRGDPKGGAIQELIAAFNFSNENQRIRDILLNLTPAQLAELKKDPRLLELAAQLDGRDREIFDALLNENSAPAKAEGLADQFDTINKENRGEKRGDELAKKFTDASSDFHSPLEGDKKRWNADIFGFEAPTAAVRERNAGHWAKMQTEFAGLERVQNIVGKQADPQQAMLRYATREITHRDSTGHGKSRRTKIVTDTVNPYHKEWLAMILEKGAESPEAKGARVLVEEKRAKPDLKGLDSATRSGRGDAQVGGGYNEKGREQGRKEAEEDRLKILKASEAARAKIEGGKPSEDMEAVKARLEKNFSAKLVNDPTGKAVAIGMLKSDAGDPIAVMEYAVKHENNELALMQLKRMDRREIQKFLDKYNHDHPNGPSLERQLGVFEHFGKSGTAFDGDKANDLTIALKGVPQNDRERGEVALLWMKLTKDQSGALGRGLANSEYKAMIANFDRLKQQMGVTDADIDGRGNLKFKDGGGTEYRGNFDGEGNFKPALGGSVSGFETAVALAKISSTAYNEATDRIASFVTTALMVIAAVVTTILTGGAAASIWIPVLVTAGAGLIGMALTYSIRGDRYTRDEMFRDFVMTMVQAATAGIGAAVGAGLRGGAGAVKALATSMRVSEQTLANLVNKGVMMRGLTLMEEMAIGAGSSAVSGAVGAAVDPNARHSEDYGKGIFHGFLRGALGGAAGAGVTRGVTAGVGGIVKGVGARSGVNAVLNRGGSMELAARVGQIRARALSTSFLTEVGTRSLASGVSGATTRVVDIAYNRIALDQKMSAGQFFEEVGWAFVQNAVQGFAEGAGDRAMRAISPQRAMEHAFTVKDQPHEFREAALGALIAEGRARGLIPMPPEPGALPAVGRPKVGGTSEAPAVPKAALEGATPHAATPEAQVPRPITGVDEHGTILPMPRAGEEGAVPMPRHEEEGLTKSSQTEPEARAKRARTPDDESGTRTITSANDNPDQPTHLHISLADVDASALPRIGVDSVLVHPDARSREAANDNFGRLLNIDPTREAAVYFNPVTGEYLVIQGDSVSVASISVRNKIDAGPGNTQMPVSRDGVPAPGGFWIIEHHYHPNAPGDKGTSFLSRLPSGDDGDFGVIKYEADVHGLDERRSRIYFVDDGKLSYTDFGFNSKDPDARYWIDFPHPVTGVRTREPFKTIEEYHAFVGKVMSDPALARAGAAGRARTPESGGEAAPAGLDPGRRVGAESATIHDKLTPRNVEDLGAVSEQMQRVKAFEDQIAGRAPKGDVDPEMGRAAMLGDAMEAVKRLGLVERPDAMIRLTAVLNNPDVPDHVKPLIARAVLEASREALIRANKLDPGDELLMFFRGASSERLEDYKRAGVDPTLATNREEDVGPGLYMSQDLESAKRYGGEESSILPFIVRRNELGNVLDISPNSPLRAQWEKFVMQNWHKHHLHPASAAMFGKKGPANPMEFGSLWFERANRVVLFDAFREHLIATHPDATVRQAAANPDIVLSDLGGPVTYGNDRGFMTDQAAMKTRLVGDLMNDQLGFPRAGTAPVGGEGVPAPRRARTADTGETPSTKLPAPVVEVLPAPVKLPVPEHMDTAIARVLARMGEESLWDVSAQIMIEADPANAFAALMAPDKETRRAALERFREGLVEKLGPEHAERRMRQLDHLAAKGGQAFRVEYEHSERLKTVTTHLDKLPPALRSWARESPALLVFALKDPVRLQALYDRYIAKNTEASALASLEFERHVLAKERKGDAALYDELRSLRTNYPGEDKALAEMATRLDPQGKTYRESQTPAPLSTEAPPVRPLAADKVVKGLRVDHPEFGRGTVQGVEGGTVTIHFDNEAPDATRSLPHGDDLLSQAGDPDPRFGDAPPFRSADKIKDEIDKLMEFRATALLPDFSQDADAGTVARIALGGEEFHGTSAGLDPPNYSLRNERRQKIYKELIAKFGLKDTGPTSQDAMFLGHAEAEAMLLAYDHFGRLPEVLEIYVDRSTCNDCRNNMMRLAKMLGVKELRVYYLNQTNPPLVRR
ncbi:hypothetical protein E5A73_06085 [Sphingomonas gei]|uniref:Uncharacterized protein n=1 Tax=Sphingomonas gei TaxID=1395960 RepID=A0A4S1XG80_9SPHN|nr:hypothetical protein [Sphingomonas gei]TGX55005.1 hypothetical protein E5A73_06085 [Sphingomonas gei]